MVADPDRVFGDWILSRKVSVLAMCLRRRLRSIPALLEIRGRCRCKEDAEAAERRRRRAWHSKTNVRAKGLAIVFFGAFQCAVTQFAEFSIEDVVAIEERQHGGAAFFDAASGAFQAFIVAEEFQGGVEGVDGLGVPAG